jgi:hypothetical protein
LLREAIALGHQRAQAARLKRERLIDGGGLGALVAKQLVRPRQRQPNGGIGRPGRQRALELFARLLGLAPR